MRIHDDLPQLAPPTLVPERRITWAVEAHVEAPASSVGRPRMGETLRATAGSGGGATLTPSATAAVPAMDALRAPPVPHFDSRAWRRLTPLDRPAVGPHRIRAPRRRSSQAMRAVHAPEDFFDPADLVPPWSDELDFAAHARVSELSTTELIASLRG